MNELNWPLMADNIERTDVECLQNFLERSNQFTQAGQVREFEQQWSRWLGVKYSLFVNSGSSANLITMVALSQLFGTGEVIVPAVTWSSDISSVYFAGLTPVFVDVNPNNLALDLEHIKRQITSKTKAVFLTHLLGFNGLTNELLDFIKEKKLILIEDVCESHGATHDGLKLGTFGLASNFSFYYAHHMSTIEGGMICTDDEDFYNHVRMLRSHGLLREASCEEYKKRKKAEYPSLNEQFIFTFPAFNVRNTELNAVLGISQLQKLDGNIEQRQLNCNIFYEHLNAHKFRCDFNFEGCSNYAFVLALARPDERLFNRVRALLNEQKVEYRVGLSGGGNQVRQPYVTKLYPQLNPLNFPQSEHLHFYSLYLGNYPGLEKEKIINLCTKLNAL